MTPEQIAALQAAALAATPGPWHSERDNSPGIIEKYGVYANDEIPVVSHFTAIETKSDAEFIAAANPATVLALIDHIAKQDEELRGFGQLTTRISKEKSALIDSAAQVRASTIEECAAAVEKHDAAGREWIPTSLWGTLTQESAARIRALALPAAPDTTAQ